jgi:hypothetical protein
MSNKNLESLKIIQIILNKDLYLFQNMHYALRCYNFRKNTIE